MAADATQEPVAIVLSRAATELRLLKERLERIEHRLEDLYFRKGRPLDADEIRAFQDVDLVVQSTAALADFLEHVAGIPEAYEGNICMRSAIKTVPLRELAERLAGRSDQPGPADDMELF
ncbi:chemotaxis protein [Thetidibacter halocola]|uniref:Chemotaxis protein n=1 Tax=Thetidibacter halocola TaxID=2827239 RepID=A0A8J7WH69_9RHOB|nr:chemotaxis protein [Thetidibacter halocola]MBS0124959.1 chemotaxis protein [Thetidibacter halocola]